METNNSGTPAPRVPLEMNIEYRRSYARQAEKGVLKNISLTGAFLEANNSELALNDRLQVTFVVSGRVRRISASIIWRNHLGYGVKFHPTNNRDVQIVDDLIYFVENKRETRKTVLADIFKHVG